MVLQKTDFSKKSSDKSEPIPKSNIIYMVADVIMGQKLHMTEFGHFFMSCKLVLIR